MYHLHKIILLAINEILKSNINKSKPKEWPQILLIIRNQTCNYEYMTLEMRQTYRPGISNNF